jgi:hypothetical protein
VLLVARFLALIETQEANDSLPTEDREPKNPPSKNEDGAPGNFNVPKRVPCFCATPTLPVFSLELIAAAR